MNAEDTRNTERILLAIPVRVLGIKSKSGEFLEDARTSVVNSSGARLPLQNSVAVNDTLRIINLHNYRKADFRVVAAAGTSDTGLPEWGVQCLDPGEDIWGIVFPPPLRGQSGGLIQCQICRQEDFAVLAPDELGTLTERGALPRQCPQCNKLTIWSYSDLSRQSAEASPGAPGDPSPRPARKTGERAAERRGVKSPILVRGPQGQEETSKTENVSSSGLSVCLAMELKVGEILQVVFPTARGASAPTLKAEVRRRSTHALAGRRLYGLRLLP
jgi:hypothetical protein